MRARFYRKLVREANTTLGTAWVQPGYSAERRAEEACRPIAWHGGGVGLVREFAKGERGSGGRGGLGRRGEESGGEGREGGRRRLARPRSRGHGSAWVRGRRAVRGAFRRARSSPRSARLGIAMVSVGAGQGTQRNPSPSRSQLRQLGCGGGGARQMLFRCAASVLKIKEDLLLVSETRLQACCSQMRVAQRPSAAPPEANAKSHADRCPAEG